MQTFFTTLYATLIGFFQDKKPSTFGLYKSPIFGLVGWQTVALTLVAALLFYYVVYGPLFLGPKTQRRRMWLFFVFLLAILGAAVAAYVSVKQGAVSAQAVSRSYRTCFAVANALVAALFFLLWSVILARAPFRSRNAQGIPF